MHILTLTHCKPLKQFHSATQTHGLEFDWIRHKDGRVSTEVLSSYDAFYDNCTNLVGDWLHFCRSEEDFKVLYAEIADTDASEKNVLSVSGEQ